MQIFRRDFAFGEGHLVMGANYDTSNNSFTPDTRLEAKVCALFFWTDDQILINHERFCVGSVLLDCICDVMLEC